MFHLYLNLAYYLPLIYVFFRIKDNFISKPFRPLYSVVYLVLASVFPIAGLHPSKGNGFMTLLSCVSDYLLPFFLYVFLAVLVFDLFLLIDLAVKITSREKRKSYRFRLYALSSILTISALIVGGGAINLNTIRVSEYQIEVPRKDSKLDHLRIAFVADAHIQQGFSLDFLQQYVRKVNLLNPDVLFYGGDLVEGGRLDGEMGKFESELRKIQPKYGSYAVPGNHEGYGRREPDNFFRNAGITLLKDSVIRIDSSFYLAGRYDQQFSRRKSIGNLIGSSPYDLPLILLDHHPTQLQEASLAPVDLQFSGHTHNGQLFPLNFIIHRMYELPWGYRKIRDTHFFVTSGLRLWGPPVKTAGKAEIMVVDIQFK